jgi:uncharacterized protein (TIGR03435 family)
MAERVRLGLGLLVAAMPIAMSVMAQTPTGQRPAFEVASIKLHQNFPSGGRFPTFSNGRFTATVPLMLLITTAYHLPFNPSPLLSGGPDWIRGPEGVYDIDAEGSLPDGLSGSAREERERLMLQSLLADRFQLVMRRESKVMPVYVLVVDKGGPKLDRAGISENECFQPAPAGQIPCHQFQGGQGRGLHARAVTIADLAFAAENWTDRPLLDRTGISGFYKIETQPFLPMEVAANPPGPGQKGEAGIDLADLPTLFQVFERLGLKMRPDKARVDAYVIDSVQRPSEN